MRRSWMIFVVVAALAGPALAGEAPSFVNWESPHIHPLDLSPDGTRLVAVNTADDRLEVFAVEAGGVLTHELSIPVGIDPVSVRMRDDNEAWVVNHISDSVSIVDLEAGVVIATVQTDDEPGDVVFAGDPERAFVSCTQANTVLVFDPTDLSAAPERVDIFGEDPRAMAVSEDGSEVYVAIFESGNGSTALGGIPGVAVAGDDVFPPNVVSNDAGPHEGVNPPPNDGDEFDPEVDSDNPEAPEVALIVKKNDAGLWLDDNGGDWTELVSGADAELSGRLEGWDLPDHDIAVIDSDTLDLSYVNRLMNICMGIAVHPDDGSVVVVGTEATNEIRFEPILEGRFIRVQMAVADPSADDDPVLFDLNPHLDYVDASIDPEDRDRSIGDPRGIVFNADGTVAYITGKGSNNVIAMDSDGERVGDADTIEVGEGPTGLVLDAEGDYLFVLNHFAASISVVDLKSEEEVEQVSFFDPTPLAIRDGRKHLYDTHRNSGLGQIACGSCHVDARMDRLAWDLGDPGGDVKTFNQNCIDIVVDCEDYHPMKGPMLTQTLRDIVGHEPFHWRGDRDGLEEFSGAFVSLQGGDESLPDDEMQEFEDFLATIHFPPNPFRNLDNTLSDDLPLPGHYTTGRFDEAGEPLPNGDAVQGLLDYRTAALDVFECVTCHTLPTGMGRDTEITITFSPTPPFISATIEEIPIGPNGEHHLAVTVDTSDGTPIKIPHLRNLYERVGFDTTQLENTAGFGFLHDGSVDSIARFVAEPVFALTSDQQVADLVAFLLSFSGGDLPEGEDVFPFTEPVGPDGQHSHAAVGIQVTLDPDRRNDDDLLDRYALMRELAEEDVVGLVARGIVDGVARGYTFTDDGEFQSDRELEQVQWDDLVDELTDGDVLTFTVVPKGTEERIGIDRDGDGAFDGDELDACSDPEDPDSLPGQGCDPREFVRGDVNGDGNTDLSDPVRLLIYLFAEGPDLACEDAADVNDDGELGLADAVFELTFLFQEGTAPGEPAPGCGFDPTFDTVECARYPECE